MNTYDATELAYMNGYKKGTDDAVHKMRDLIKERCIKGGIYPAFVASTIENVANELIDNAIPANLVSLEDVLKAIKDYDQGKVAVEVTEFNAEIQKTIMEMCNESPT
jgi:hypothetical protein